MWLKKLNLKKHLIKRVFANVDGVISISENLKSWVQDFTNIKCRHIKVPILVEFEQFNINKLMTNVDVPYIFHAGTLLQQKDGILGMIEAFAIARKQLNTPIRYILTSTIDESSHPNEIRELMINYQIEDCVEFVGYLNRDQIRKFLAGASLVISNRPKSIQDYYGFSTKVGEYLASGTPLITTNWGEIVNWVEHDRSAYIVEPDNLEALSKAIVYAFENKQKSYEIGHEGKVVCRESFDYCKWSQRLADYFKSL